VVRAGENLVFCHQVAVASAVVRRCGAVQAGGWLSDHVMLGVLEGCLSAGEIEELVEDFACWEQRQRLLSAAMAVRLLLAATLIPDGDVPDVMHRVAGLLELLPWARPWHAPGTEALTRRMVRYHPEVFAADRLFLIDRNFLGFELVKDIRAAGAHLLMRMKSDVALPLLEALPDGSYRSFLAGRDCCIPLRVIEYDVAVPGRDDQDRELFALATTLTDRQAYPAGELAGLYPRRWGASETTIGQDKSAITGAGPPSGPILRSGTPHQVTQEIWAWITATQLLRIHAARAAAGQHGSPPPAPGGCRSP
jgi:Insertion element 4 transposase N-terminal